MFKKLKEVIDQAQKEAVTLQKDPSSPRAKAHARRGGVVMLIIAAVLLGVGWLEWTIDDAVHIIFPVGGVVLFVFGLWVIVTGKMPKA